MEEIHRCSECGIALAGRKDKKFCSDHCRNYYNNRLKQKTPYMKHVEGVLRRNRNILRELLREREGLFHRRVNRKDMSERGFDFDFFTNVVCTGKLEYVFFCYEYGFAEQGDDLYLITRRSRQSMPSD